jgi:hypothetical protein
MIPIRTGCAPTYLYSKNGKNLYQNHIIFKSKRLLRIQRIDALTVTVAMDEL